VTTLISRRLSAAAAEHQLLLSLPGGYVAQIVATILSAELFSSFRFPFCLDSSVPHDRSFDYLARDSRAYFCTYLFAIALVAFFLVPRDELGNSLSFSPDFSSTSITDR
jgi:hypothetical protein